jgi:signal transduction histidine kinase
LTLAHLDDQASIQIQDCGVGIPLQDQSRIFERFYRVDEARARTTGGHGLGLAIVKTLVEGMGGNITVRSKLGEGSIFTIVLPTLDREM